MSKMYYIILFYILDATYSLNYKNHKEPLVKIHNFLFNYRIAVTMANKVVVHKYMILNIFPITVIMWIKLLLKCLLPQNVRIVLLIYSIGTHNVGFNFKTNMCRSLNSYRQRASAICHFDI